MEKFHIYARPYIIRYLTPALTCWLFAIDMISIANCHVALKRSRASQDFILWCSMCISWMKSLSFFQFLKDFGSMITVEITGVVILVVTLTFAPSCDAQSRRRRIMHSAKLPGQSLVFMESVIYARSNPNCGLTQAVGLRDSL